MSFIPNGVSAYDRFSPPIGTDTVTVEYPDNVTEIYRFRRNGKLGVILKSVELIYSASDKKELLSVEVV